MKKGNHHPIYFLTQRAAFYDPVVKWINEYFSSCAERETTLEFEIVYFNSSTSKIFMSLFSMLDSHAGTGKKIRVIWKATEENETAIECGEEFKEDLENLEFSIKVI